MSDPLSVAASLVGLLTAAAQVSLILNNLITKAKAAPKECKTVRSDVDDIRNVLGQLQMFIVGTKQASRSRRALIMVDQVTATLASCVTTFDSFKLFVEGLQSDQTMGILDRIRWITKEDELQSFQNKIGAHKATLSLMLIILTCQKQDDAEDKVDALNDSIEELKALNAQILARMIMWDLSKIGPQIQTGSSGAQLALDDQAPTYPIPNAGVSRSNTVDSIAGGPITVQKDSRGFAFEELLMNTRAYKKAAHNNSDAFSVITSAGRTATWSVLSGLSLSEMSNVAILAIPVYQSDLHDKEAYDFETLEANLEPGLEGDDHQNAISPKSPPKPPRSVRGWLKSLKPKVDHPSREEPSPKRVFGVPLHESIYYANVAISLTNEEGESFIYGYVPVIVAKIGVFLKEKGTFTEDIFAKNGHPVRMSNMQVIFNSPDRYGKGLDWTGYTVFDAASLLLRYLKSLPEPVIPFDLYHKFTAPLKPYQQMDVHLELNDQEHSNLVKSCQRCVIELPALNRQLLLYLLDMLAVFASKSDVNNMTAARLAGVFNPGIISERPTVRTQDDHQLANNLLIFLVENQDNFLIGMSGTETGAETETENRRDTVPISGTEEGIETSTGTTIE